MSKKIDWSKVYVEPCKRKVSPDGKYSSGKDMLTKSFEALKQQEEIMAKTRELLPVMAKLFEIRATNGLPLKIMRPIHYSACELVKSERSEGFVDTIKTLHPGDEILLKSLDPNLQVFVFTKKNGEEIEISYSEQQKLLTNSDIYEVVSQLYKK